jgi:predicted RNA-binding Zn ribbon-like protein
MNNQYIRKGFYFLGGDRALDFVNTKPLVDGDSQEQLSDFSALVRWFSAAGLIGDDRAGEISSQTSDPEGRAALRQVLEFRENLRSAILALETSAKIPEGIVEEVNALLKQHPIAFQLVKQGGRVVKKLELSPVNSADLIGILASLAADLFSLKNLGRIHKCDSCVLHFYDKTKSNTRRWCTMKICGNRAKVAKYAARQRRG